MNHVVPRDKEGKKHIKKMLHHITILGDTKQPQIVNYFGNKGNIAMSKVIQGHTRAYKHV